MNIEAEEVEILSKLGFNLQKGGAHSSRTMMLEELRLLLSYVEMPGARKKDYVKAIIEENCLGKRSGRTRKLTAEYLIDLYALDRSVTLFRALLYFWNRDVEGQRLLALLSAYSRDAILRSSAPFVLNVPEGAAINRQALEEYIEGNEPHRFSKATLKSTAQNLNATWTQSGHLKGRIKKVRAKALATPGSAAYALFLGYLRGDRGEGLLTTEYARLLDCSPDRVIELAEDASRRGWIVFKRVGNVIEVLFNNLLTA
ncbi:MAG: hypothetical protein SF339_09615 [Blastocatellia bacterium]|nr:hypothetical protein [Blastocatellia bacterium]